jgi:hypothetical protein
MANTTSCGDQTYFGSTTNLPNNISYDNLSGTITVSGTSVTTANTGTITMATTGTYLNSTAWGPVTLNKDLTDFCELVLSALGHDATYDDFCKMSSSERRALLRDIKIKRVLD